MKEIGKKNKKHHSRKEDFTFTPPKHFLTEEKKSTKTAALALYLIIGITVFFGFISLLTRFFGIDLF